MAKKLEQREPSVSFNLQRMGDIYEQAEGQSDVPHRHDYYTVLLIGAAQGVHFIDYQAYVFAGQQIHFVSPGQVHQVVLKSKPKGVVITFSKEFLMENSIPESFISNINLFRQFGETPPIEIDQQTFEKFDFLIQEMEHCFPTTLHYRTRALGALLQLFLIYANNSLAIDTTQLDEQNSGVCLFRNFKNLVEKNYQQWHKVSHYAPEVHVSAKHLSTVVKSLSGKTAKTFIQDRLILEAKRYLLHTELSVKEIAYQLGFEEPLHFSGFFKKQTGKSATDFRKLR